MSSPPLTPSPYRIAPIADVSVQDRFWSPRMETNRTVTIPHAIRKSEETGRIANFAKAAGRMPGSHEGIFYNDSDVFKVVEAAAHALTQAPDPALDAKLDEIIELIAAAQEPDGYLYTARTIDPGAVSAEREGLTRWSNLRVNHELYNVGHLYEAAVAHYRATGKRTLLDVALRSADLVDATFGPHARRDIPGHQEIEIGLVALHAVTGEDRYLRLARFFLDERGRANGRELYQNHDDPGYMQDHLPVSEQHLAVGHAVRAAYMYAAMADVAALGSAPGFVEALDALWEDVVARKLYVTGGIGARHRGEAFGDAYELPNATAYAETCAAVGLVLWAQRMFRLHGRGAYVDVLERALYNAFLVGVSLEGDRFFYPNPLESDGSYAFNRGAATRQPWFDCSCCPTNVARTFPSLGRYVWAQRDDTLFLNLFVAGRARAELAGVEVALEVASDYPWDGHVRVHVSPASRACFEMAVRVPGWTGARPLPGDLYRYIDDPAGPVRIEVNGEPASVRHVDGYARIDRCWSEGDVVDVHLPMGVRRVAAHPSVAENRGRVSIERGPIVYCAEGVDNAQTPENWSVQGAPDFAAAHEPDLLGGVTVLRGDGLVLVPYHVWSHRGENPMRVWLEDGSA